MHHPPPPQYRACEPPACAAAARGGAQGLRGMGWRVVLVWACGALLAWVPGAHALAQAGTPGIYTCTDSQGRRITSDRPIMECLDREQRELAPYGGVRRTIPPSLTADERAEQAAQAREQAGQQARLNEERRQDRALVARYKSAKEHDQERRNQLKAQHQAQAMIQQQTLSLQQERQALLAEMEFYKADPSKAPALLRHRLNDNTEQQASQQRRLAAQQDEVARINARFDEELKRLEQLWAAQRQPRPGR